MKRRILVFAFLLVALCMTAAWACAAVTISGYDSVDMQLGLSTEQPVSGGFYSRGVEFHYAIDDLPTDTVTSTIVWSVAPTNGGPALAITAEGQGRDSARAWLNLDPAVSYAAGRDYTYDIAMNINGTITTRTITVNFVNDQLPTGYGLTVAPVTLTSSPAVLGTAVPVTNGEMYNITKETYVVSIEVTGTSLGYYSGWRDWSDVEWEELDPWDSRLAALNLDGGKTGIYTAKKMGKYPKHSYTVSFYGNGASNMACYIPYTLYVTDENGNVPALAPEIHGSYNWADWNATSFRYQIYTDLNMDSANLVWIDPGVIRLYLSNADELASEYGGHAAWNVTETVISGEKLNYSFDNDDYGCHGSLRRLPTTPSESDITVSCTWGGQTTSVTIHVTADDSSVLPYGLPDGISNLPDEIETQVGQTLTLEPGVLPSGYYASGYSGSYFCAQGLWEFAERDWNESIPTYTVTKAGTFTDTIGIQFGPMMITKQVTFKVKDENGKLPTVSLVLSSNHSRINRYLGFTREMEEDTGVFSWNALADARIDDNLYQQLEAIYGGKPVWKAEQTAGATLPLSKAEENGGRAYDVRLESWDLAGYQPGTAEITITCTWGDQTATSVTQVNILNLPNGMPSGIDYNNGSDVVECQIGDTLMITPGILPATWGGIPGFASVYVGNSGEFEEFCDILDEGDWGRKVKVTKAGYYQCFVGVGTDTVTAGRWVTYAVKDENGVVPSPAPEMGGYFSFTEGIDLNQTARFFVASDLPFDSDSDDVLYSVSELFSYGIENWWKIEGFMKETPNFDVELISGNVSYRKEIWDDNSHVAAVLTSMPAEGSAVFKATCTVGNTTYSQNVQIDFVRLPSRPAGVEIGYSNPRIAKFADSVELRPDIHFKNHWGMGQNTYSLYGGGDFWDAVVWEHSAWNQTGVFTMQMIAASDNIRMNKTIKTVVTETDGTMQKSDYTPFGSVWVMPDAIRTIESGAFTGTKLTEADIPAGVSIAADAFDGTDLVAVYCHDQGTIDYAVQHGYVAVVD